MLGIPLWVGAPTLRMPAQPAAFGQIGAASEKATEDTFHLHGTVIDGATGRPVARVLVASQDRRLATMTNTDGVFDFNIKLAGVVTGRMQGEGAFGPPKVSPNETDLRFFFDLRKPGYLEPEERLSVSYTGTSADVKFRLMPACVITGRVFTSSSSIPGDVPVTLLWRGVVNGERAWIPGGSVHTHRDGSFRFTNLGPGEYTVMTAEWRGDEPTPSQANVKSQEYPPLFFGDTTTLASATKLHVHYGEVAQTDLHLRLAAYFPVKVPVAGPANAEVNVRVDSGDGLEGFQLGYNEAEHAVEGALPSGTYRLDLSSSLPQQAFGTAVLHVADGPVQTAPVTLIPPAPLTVRVRREFAGQQLLTGQLPLRVFLQMENRAAPFVDGVNQSGEDDIIVPHVAPGRYRVHFETRYGYPASVQYAGVDLQTQSLVIGDGGATGPIDVTLRDDTGRVEGSVAAGGPLPQVTFVCLVPLSPGGRLGAATVGPDGKFMIADLVPGTYRLFAAPRPPWQLPWHDPETLQNLEGKGVSVTVMPRAHLQADAPLLDDTALGSP